MSGAVACAPAPGSSLPDANQPSVQAPAVAPTASPPAPRARSPQPVPVAPNQTVPQRPAFPKPAPARNSQPLLPLTGLPSGRVPTATLDADRDPEPPDQSQADRLTRNRPSGVVAVRLMQLQGGRPGNAARVVAGMRASFRVCYRRALVSAPESVGKLLLEISVAESGIVSSVDASKEGAIPDQLVKCVKRRALAAVFAPPVGGRSVLTVPLEFVRQ